jgi:acyl-CoA dehydrogenase
VTCYGVPYANGASWVLVGLPGRSVLLSVAASERTNAAPRTSAATLYWREEIASRAQAVDAPAADFLNLQACLLAAEMAGAMLKILRMTLQYANERAQFGRSIGKFQAIQHQISVMAENTALARTAARFGCSSHTHLPHADAAAIAKSLTSEAAVSIAAIAHAVHGAIGITEEYDLQLYTRRLHEWRRIAGSESYWNERIGAALIAGSAPVLDFVRRDLTPTRSETLPGER